MMPGQIPEPSLTAGTLPGLGLLSRIPGSALTAEELKYPRIHSLAAMISPLHFLEVKLGKRPQPVKSELDEEEERRKRRREKNKVAAARCRNKKKERTEFLQRDSSDDMKKVQRREKNRIAAQKSRQRQTQKADALHLESEGLEHQNAALRKEIRRLTEEVKYFSSLLSTHEPLCALPPAGPPQAIYGPHAFQPHISSPRFQH